MTSEEAHKLLDGAKRGEPVSAGRIAQALRATGDIDCLMSLQVVCAPGDWELTGAGSLRRADVFDGLLA
jgi:hypothetical protein